MRVRLLGEFIMPELDRVPTAPQERLLIGYLALRAGEAVRVQQLQEVLWPDHRTKSELTTLRSRITALRGRRAPIVTKDRGATFKLDVARNDVDALVLRDESNRLERSWQKVPSRQLHDATSPPSTSGVAVWQWSAWTAKPMG